MKPFVNPKEIKIEIDNTYNLKSFEKNNKVDKSFIFIKKLLSKEEIENIKQQINNNSWIPVGINGMKGDYVDGDPIGSYRLSSYQEDFSKTIFTRLINDNVINEVKKCEELTKTDFDNHENWLATSLNPLLRFIKYKNGGFLVPHYDAPYIENESFRTLQTLVIYLDDDQNIKGGETRFIKDIQKNTPVKKMNLNDWEKPADDKDVILSLKPETGDAIIFDHSILHESHILIGEGEKNIIRTDIMFQKLF